MTAPHFEQPGAAVGGAHARRADIECAGAWARAHGAQPREHRPDALVRAPYGSDVSDSSRARVALPYTPSSSLLMPRTHW